MKVTVASTREHKHESSPVVDESGVVAATVPSKYAGTASDKKDMQTLGKVQVLRVSTDNRA
jgi:hypothetical protein